MNPERVSTGTEEGFTLVEILVAVVILSVGLLGLEALGIHAIRSLTLADRNSSAAVLASEHLEDGLQQLRQGVLPGEFASCPVGNSVIARTVNTDNPNLPRVTVTVASDSTGIVGQPISVSSSAYSPDPLAGPAPDVACPAS